VDEKGMPPSKLMLEHAAQALNLLSAPAQCSKQETSSDLFNCDLCDYSNPTQRGVIDHKGHKHKEQQKPVALSDELEFQISFNCDKCKCDLGCEDSLKRHMEEKHRIFKCDFCDYADRNKHSIRLHMADRHSDFKRSDDDKTQIYTFHRSTADPRGYCLKCNICGKDEIGPFGDNFMKHIDKEHSNILIRNRI
jgi:DNA-directed RNA polymerase subunit M/transcription elongation factor TFIIS